MRKSLISPTARDEIAPELAQQVAPFDLVVGDTVELFFEVGGEIIFDIAGKEAFQERDDDAAAVFRHQPALVDADIFAVLQNLQDRGIGRGPADAELLHALDQRGLGVTRRRLGEVLGGSDRLFWSSGSPAAMAGRRRDSSSFGFVVAGLPDRGSGSRRT